MKEKPNRLTIIYSKWYDSDYLHIFNGRLPHIRRRPPVIILPNIILLM